MYKGFASDCWSLGVLLFVMLNGSTPFKANSMKELRRLLKEGKLLYTAEISEGINHLNEIDAKSLIEGLMKFNPEERFTLNDVLVHPWLGIERENTNSIKNNDLDLHFNERNINKATIRRLEEFGYNQQMITKSLCRGELNHITATYKLLIMK